MRRRLAAGPGRLLVVGAAVVALLFVCWSLVEARLLSVDEVVVTSPEIPPELDGVRLVYASDVHAGSLLGRPHLKATMARIESLDPDFVVFGGDFGGGGRDGYDWFYEEVSKVEAPLGVYAVLGNHEGGGMRESATAGLERAGVVLLVNDNVRIGTRGAGIRLAGLDDFTTGDANTDAAATDISEKEYAILLSHDPDALPALLPKVRGAFDLALSGHTHGGQITAFGLWAPYMPSRYGQRFRGGWTDVENVPVLVSRGAGVYVLPMRFFARPEIHAFTLRRAEVERVVP